MLSTGSSADKRLRERLGMESGVSLPSQVEATPPRRTLNNAKTDVIATVETLPDTTVKYLFRVIYVAIVLAAMGLISLIVVKVEYGSKLRSNSVLIWNTSIASCGIFALLICFGCYLSRIYLVNSRGLNWSERRWKGAILFNIELVTQLLNLCFYLIPNVYLLVNECGWYDQFIVWMAFSRMTCWNTLFLLFVIMSSNSNLVKDKPGKVGRRSDGSVFDKPMLYHFPKTILWWMTEGFLLAVSIRMETDSDCTNHIHSVMHREVFDCGLEDVFRYLIMGAAFCFVAYFCASLFYFRRGYHRLSGKQYLNYRMANIMIRLQFRLQMIVHTFHLCSFGLLYFVDAQSCPSFFLSWLGFLPSQFAMTVIVCVKCYLFIPLRPTEDDFVLQVWLREYSWSEEELPELMDKRGNGCCNTTAPMFCFERAVKTLYWSTFIYDFKQVADSKLSLKTAMRLYDLTEYELFHEEMHDTMLLVAWNKKMALLAFRGTSSLKNLLADLRVARIPHPPVRGRFMSQPMVHRGFLQTWNSNGLNHRVLELLQTIMKDEPEFSIVLTGHSLGGAVATLAAYDIRMHLNVPPCRIDCYTFGAPRVGNYAFAHEYNELVPNTWNVINDQDYITRTMKFVGMYKRPGQRVIINGKGDMLVRPSFIEMSLSRTTGVVNLAHHLLNSYQTAFLTIARTQFSEDSIEGGYEGMLRMSNTLKHVLGVSRARLIQELSWGQRIKSLEKKKKAEGSKLYLIASTVSEFLKDVEHYVSDRLEAGWKWTQNPMSKSTMDGIEVSGTRLCGGMMCNIKRLEMEKVDGLCLETGHVSLESQQAVSEKAFHTRPEHVREESDLSTIV